MPKTRRGGNRPERVTRGKIHRFSKSREQLEDMEKEELLELAKDLDVLDRVEIDSELRDTPNSEELIEVLAPLKHQTIT